MSALDTGRVVSNRRRTPADEIRLALYADVRQAGADPSGFLDDLAQAVAGEIWIAQGEERGETMTFRQFVEEPFPDGIGSSVDVVLKLSRLPHRNEDEPTKRAKMAAMRDRVRALIEEEGPGTTKNGGDRRSDAFSVTCNTERPSGKRGNTRAYKIARLKAHDEVHGTDFAARVIGKELSAAAAMRESGLDPVPTGLAALRRAWGQASAEERAAFLAEIEVG